MALDPQVSVVIPVRNGALWLDECLGSVAAQTSVSWECVLVDDGSTDSTPEVLDGWSRRDPRFRTFRIEASGVIAACNRGFAECRGGYVARLDADDRMSPGRLQAQVDFLKGLQEHKDNNDNPLQSKTDKTDSPKTEPYKSDSAKIELTRIELTKQDSSKTEVTRGHLVTGGVRYFSDAEVSEGYARYQEWLNSLRTPEQFVAALFVECPVAAPAWTMARADVLALGGFAEGVYPEDYDFILRAAATGIQFHSLPQEVLEWRHHPSRSSLRSELYSEERFWQLRLRHLPGFVQKYRAGRAIALWSAGPGGKRLADGLRGLADGLRATSAPHPSATNQDQSFPSTPLPPILPEFFVERHPSRIGQIIRGLPVIDVREAARWRDHYILVSVGSKGRGPDVEAQLQAEGLRPVQDYLLIG